jgi:hypothetical protein
MLFGMANELASFDKIINKILKDMINLPIVTYINNILIYSQAKKEY